MQELESQVGNILQFQVKSIHKKFNFSGEASYGNVIAKLNKQIIELDGCYSQLIEFRK